MTEYNDYRSQISDSINSIFELTTRVDERVQHLIKAQEDFEQKMSENRKSINALASKVSVLESKEDLTIRSSLEGLKNQHHRLEMEIAELKRIKERSSVRWKSVLWFIAQVGIIVLAAYLLFILGIKP